MHRLTEFSLRRPWFMGAILLSITVGLAAGIPNIQPGYGYRVLLGDHHPAVQNLDAMVEEYAGGSPIRIAWECGENHPCQTALDEASLRMAARVSRQLELLPAVRAVQGPADAALLVPVSNGFAIRHFLEDGQIPADAEALAQRALEDRFWRNTLVSSDGSVGVILVQTTDNRPQTMVEVVDAIDSTLAIPRETGFSYYLTGDAPASVIDGRSLSGSMGRTIPFLIIVISLLLLAFTGSWQHTLTTLTTMGVALLWAFGLLGWLAWPEDGILEVLAPLILVVGVCDAVHVSARYAEAHAEVPRFSRAELILRATREAGTPCLLTTLTTAGAYLSFTTSALDTFLRFGVISAFGVVTCLLLTFSLLPLINFWLTTEAPHTRDTKHLWMDVMDAIIRTTRRRSVTLLVSSTLLLLFFGWGWFQLRVDQNWLESIGDQNESVQAVRFMEDRMGFSENLEVELELPDKVTLEAPVTLQTIDEITRSLLKIPDLTESTSVLTLIARINRLLHDDDPDYERVGETTAANAEILEILGFDDPETLGRWISLDRSKVRVSFETKLLPHSVRNRILGAAHSAIEARLPEGWNYSVSGEVAMNHDWVRDVQATQLRSFPTAFAIVFVLVSIFLRSWKLGLAAMVPTLLPVVVILGLMGWAGLTLDVARAMIAAVVIGIGVDDAVHILAHYKVQRGRGADPRAAMQAALRHTGRAVVTTSAALSLGFLTLMMSAWQTIASFGFLVSIAILGALAASLFVLPALIFAFAPAGETAPRPANPRISVHSPGEVR